MHSPKPFKVLIRWFNGDTLLLSFSLMMVVSCSTVYYNVWEALGKEKRDLLKSNVLKVKEDQDEVQEEFRDTLEKVRSKYKLNGGNLEKIYDQLSGDYDDAKAKSDTLSKRIDKVEEIAEDLFAEWETEANQITNPTYRRDSLSKRKATMRKFSGMHKAMRRVESSLKPVLTKLKDQVLYLKHNLNAQAIGAFKVEFEKIAREINSLSGQIKRSSRAADDFIANMN